MNSTMDVVCIDGAISASRCENSRCMSQPREAGRSNGPRIPASGSPGVELHRKRPGLLHNPPANACASQLDELTRTTRRHAGYRSMQRNVPWSVAETRQASFALSIGDLAGTPETPKVVTEGFMHEPKIL